MELKATSLGKHLAQHPYNRVRLLNAGVEVSGEKHEYLIPFNQLLGVACKRGLIWGELEFSLPDEKVVRLHGTEWNETLRFYHFLNQAWAQWSHEMSEIAAGVLNEQAEAIRLALQQDRWLKRTDIGHWQAAIRKSFDSIPLPVSRLDAFDNCRADYQFCMQWMTNSDTQRQARNTHWTERMLEQHAEYFRRVESSPLNAAQARSVINGEDSVLVLAGAGSGKTSVLVARVGWLMLRRQATADQILLLAFGRQAAEEMNERLRSRLNSDAFSARTFHSLALHIIRQGSKKSPLVSKLESDTVARHTLLINAWREQCSQKKSQANGWRQWLTDELEWELDEGSFWQNERLTKRLATRLDRWLGLMRMHGGSQTTMIEQAPEEVRELFSKRIKLMAPLLKAWKQALKEEGAVDFSGLIHQATNILDKGRFISPWKHILVDEFQDISPQRAQLLAALRRQNSQTALFAAGDDWQAIYRFSGAEMTLTTAFHHYFGEGDSCVLDTTYRFNQRIGDIASSFIQRNPHQLKKTLSSISKGDKKAIQLLPEEQLEALFNKMSGYVKPHERIMVLARYHHLRPMLLEKAVTRWPNLTIEFMTIHSSKGQQAEYVVLLGLDGGKEGFPAPAKESVIEAALLPPAEAFPDAEERRLAYVAITRAIHQVWLLYDRQDPSPFVVELERQGVKTLRKP